MAPIIVENRSTVTSTAQKLAHLSGLSGLTCFEREFVARCRAQAVIPAREQIVLDKIWDKHKPRRRAAA